MEWVLDRKNRLNGARVATVRVRPLRLAYIIPDDDPQIAIRVINSCCLTWGGMANPLIPYSKTKGFSPLWSNILQKLDPDKLVDCVGISKAEQQLFADRGQHIHRWDKPLESFFMDGALQYSARNAFGKGFKDDQANIVIQPKLDSESDPRYLPLIAHWGKLDERFIDEILKLHQWEPEVRYSNCANIEEANFSNETKGIFLGLTPSDVARGKSGDIHFYSFLSLTKVGLHEQGAPYDMPSSPEDPQDEEAFVNTIVVTGQKDCVSDLCLYWDLRIERYWARFFPLWIPLDILDTDTGLEIVKFALGWTKGIAKGLSRKPHLYILSTSVNKKTLEGRLKGKLAEAKYEVKGFDRFISGKCDFYHIKEDKEVFFVDGSVRVPIPRCEPLKQFGSMDRVNFEISFQGIRLPQSKSLRYRLWGSLPRLTKRGFENFSYAFDWPDMVAIGIPDYWTILTSIFKDAEYNCQPSDKSVFALGLLSLIGNLDDLGVIASSKVYEVLRQMCRVRGQEETPREYFAERIEFTYSRFKEAWGQETDVILDWLINKGMVFRGARIKCPNCQLARWYELDSISRTWHCDGCLSDLKIPLELDRTEWRYRVNELYAVAHDQGVITQLLSIYAVHPPAMHGEVSILGYYPGVKITTDSEEIKQQIGIEQMELDLVSIRDGRLIIGECKGVGENLNEEEVNRYVNLANHTQCSRILFITPTSFPQAKQLFAPAQKRSKALIKWLERKDIFDISVRERMGSSDDREISNERKAGEYLKRLANLLQQ